MNSNWLILCSVVFFFSFLIFVVFHVVDQHGNKLYDEEVIDRIQQVKKKFLKKYTIFFFFPFYL